MRSSSICRSSGVGRRAVAGLVAAIAACSAIATGHAIDPERAPSQYIRDRWEGSSGFPGGPVYAITQSADGYLWVAAERGLVRFDGLSYRLFQPTELSTGNDSVALQIAPDPAGTLWARLRRADFVHYRNGAFEHVAGGPGPLTWQATAMSSGNDGAILVADRLRGVIVTRRNRYDTILGAGALPESPVISVAQTSNGDIWLGTRDSGLVRVRGGHTTPVVQGLPDQKINCLVPDGRDHLWIGTDSGVVRWDGRAVTSTGLPAALARVHAMTMIRDRDANLWIGTADSLLRVNSDGLTTIDRRASGSAVTALFEDREGILWIGTTAGIERWRDGAFATYSEVRAVTPDNAGPIFVDAAERVWFAPSRGGLYWLHDGRVEPVTGAGLSDDVVYSISGSGEDLWIGRQRGGLTHLRARGGAFTTETFTQADGLPQNQVYAVHRARDGAVWVGTLSGGASRLRDGVFTTYTTAQGLASNTVAAVIEAADGAVWFATPNGVSVRSAGRWRRYSRADGLPSDDVNTLLEDSAHNVWVGTTAGLAVVRNGRVQSGLAQPDSLKQSILGIAEDAAGWLWVASADGVRHVDRGRLLSGALRDDGLREYGATDGLLGIEGVKRHRSLTVDSRGRIWLSTNGGLAMVDPARLARRGAPALVHVEDLSADGSRVERAREIRVPPHRQRITLTFSGLSLSAPERVQFRYRLDGFDSEWSAPISARQAEYTNLGPGSYRFRVVASNSDGVWNSEEAALPFTVVPALWQARWFQLSVFVLLAAAVWAAYRLRVMQVARRLDLRFEERLAERTRIAQELHDTLLQGFLSASMQLHVATDSLPADSPARPSLTKVLDLMGRVIEEGRTAVRGLRSSTSSHDLEHAFSQISHELGTDDTVDYRVIVEGRERPLNPLIRDEVYRIGREALGNAFRHAAATRVDLEIEYAPAGLRLLVRDNGRGIDEAVLETGRDGHWGLAGMRERADRIGARFTTWSRVGAGTEIELSVPARVAFVDPSHDSGRKKRQP